MKTFKKTYIVKIIVGQYESLGTDKHDSVVVAADSIRQACEITAKAFATTEDKIVDLRESLPIVNPEVQNV